MIVLGEKHGDVNVIHIIVGQESDFQLNFSGQIIVDMTGNVDFQSGDKILLIFNKCDSEEILRQQIQYFKQENESQKEKTNSKIPNKTNSDEIPSSNKKIYIKNLKCPKCSSWGTYAQEGKITMCKTCLQIEEGLKSKTIPPHPDTNEKSEIFNKLLKDPDFKNFLSDTFSKSKKEDSNES